MEEDKQCVLKLVFSGDAKKEGEKVNLSVPASVALSIYTGTTGAAYHRFTGNFDETVQYADIDDLTFPGLAFYYFNTMYFIESEKCAAMDVKLDSSNKDAGTFSVV